MGATLTQLFITVLYPFLPKSLPYLLVVYLVSTNKAMTTESQQYNCFIRNGRNAIPKHACPEVEGSNSTTGLNLYGVVTHSGEILTTGKSHKKKPDGFLPTDDSNF
jgi:hypothetical protein